ncbi:hypothetical protein CLOP_g1938 [Closterium sp. NIES-67]|nr:hypothetical protein CLOP_g1938 [Closterium sp. NIES-67]
MELHVLLLGSIACLVALRGVASVRVHAADVRSLLVLASEWNNFQGSETWGLRYADCKALDGIACDRDGFVTDIFLQMKSFNAPIPDMISQFQHLTQLALPFCHLKGSIPDGLFNLTSLVALSLLGNSVTGTIPVGISRLVNLQILALHVNQLSGPIDPLCNLPQLRYLGLSFNQLQGPVEPVMRGMANITYLYLTSNQFSGRLPSPPSAGIKSYKVEGNFFSHGQVNFSNCSAVTWTTLDNCLSPYLGICGLVYPQRSAGGCAAFCGVEVGATSPVCGGHGSCFVNAFTGSAECACDPNYMLNSSNGNACVPGAARTSLASDSAYVSLRGSASVLSNGSILLTNGAANQQGAAFGSPAVRLFYFPDKRSRCGTELGFLAAFSFAMSPGGQGGGGRGLRLWWQQLLPKKGASVGLGGVGRRSVGVEFDSVLSVKHSDPNDNHVGVNVGGSPVSLASATAPLILNDAQTKHAWIHYDPTSGGTLRVFLSSDPVQPPTPTLTASVSLCSALKPTASDSLFLFGFVALSSTAPQKHAILSWDFTTGVPPVGQ